MSLSESLVIPVFGGEEQDIAKQKHFEGSTLLNADLSGGMLEPRKGFRVLGTVDEWQAATDESGKSRYERKSMKYLAFETAEPLGSYLFSAPSGSDYVIVIYRYKASTTGSGGPGPYVFCGVFTTAGDRVNTNPLPATQERGQADNTILVTYKTTAHEREDVYDDPVGPYVFAEFGSVVYFTNGGAVWMWSEWMGDIKCASTDNEGYYRNPFDENQHIYLNDMRGASLIVEHNSHMVYAGFSGDTWIACDSVIDPTSDETISTKDYAKEGIKITPAGDKIRAQETLLLISDPSLPRCVKVTSVIMLPNIRKVTAIASYQRHLVIWSDSDMFLVNAGGSVWSGRRYCGVGCAAHRSVVKTSDGRLMWLSLSGVYSWDGSSLPVLASAPVSDSFSGAAPVVGLPRAWADVVRAEDVKFPHVVAHNLERFASAAEIVPDGLYCLALKAGSGVELNDMTLCIQYTTGKVWWWTSGGEYDDAGDVVQSINAGNYTLMSSKREPGKLFAQGYAYVNMVAQGPGSGTPNKYKTNMAITAMDKDNGSDESLTFASTGADPTISDVDFTFLYISRRFHFDDRHLKLYRRLAIRMFATHDDEACNNLTSAGIDANRLLLALLPELSSFEAVNELYEPSTSDAQEFTTTLNPWPREFASPKAYYFWQPGAGDNTYGKWKSDSEAGAFNTHKWLPYQPFTKRVALRTPRTQFARIALLKVVDSDSGATPRVISIGLVGKGVPDE